MAVIVLFCKMLPAVKWMTGEEEAAEIKQVDFIISQLAFTAECDFYAEKNQAEEVDG